MKSRQLIQLVELHIFRGRIYEQVALFIVFVEERLHNEMAMFLEELLHRRAVIEEVLDNPQDFVAILEMCGEPIYIDDDVDNWNFRQDVQGFLILLVRC